MGAISLKRKDINLTLYPGIIYYHRDSGDKTELWWEGICLIIMMDLIYKQLDFVVVVVQGRPMAQLTNLEIRCCNTWVWDLFLHSKPSLKF